MNGSDDGPPSAKEPTLDAPVVPADVSGDRAAPAADADGCRGEPSLIDFPASIDIKAMGLSEGDFETLVRELVLPHVPEPGPESVTRRESSGGRYVSVRVRFTATSKYQLETIYGALRAEPRVLFTL